jgi:hypothetical protein
MLKRRMGEEKRKGIGHGKRSKGGGDNPSNSSPKGKCRFFAAKIVGMGYLWRK